MSSATLTLPLSPSLLSPSIRTATLSSATHSSPSLVNASATRASTADDYTAPTMGTAKITTASQQTTQQQQQQLILTSPTAPATYLHLHAIYPKNKRKNYNKIHKERRKRLVTNDDDINSYLSLILLVTFTKPLCMWYRFIKSIIFKTSSASAKSVSTTSTLSARATQRLFSKGSFLKSSSTATISTSNSSPSFSSHCYFNRNKTTSSRSSLPSSSLPPSSSSKCIRVLPPIGTTTSFFTLLTIICLETILLSTMSSCAKTFYMHWNTSNSIFRIDNTDHIIDVNKGNLAFEFDQVHIICPVYEPGTFDNETEKYIIYNVSKVEYETCRITNADPRVIAICDKPQKLMFFTITFRPFTPQPGGLEFLPGNDYYFISTSSKDDLYRRIGGRCSTNNMKVVFKVCCASEEKNKTTTISTGNTAGAAGSSGATSTTAVGSAVPTDSAGNSGEDITNLHNNQQQTNHPHHGNNINTIGINGINTGMLPNGVMNTGAGGGLSNNQHNGLQLTPIMNSPSGNVATSINTNIDQFNRIPMQPNSINVLSNNIGGGMNMGQPGMSGNNGLGLGSHGGSGILLTPGHNGINMIASGGNPGGIPGIHQYPGHGYHGQTGIRINNVPSTHHTNLKNMQNNNNDNDHHPYNKHPNEVVKNEELTYNRAASSMTTTTALSFFCLLTLATQICYWV